MPKIKLAVLYGGKSAEHTVSVNSAESVYANLNPSKYEVFPIYISRQGKWYLQTRKIGKDKSAPLSISFENGFNIFSLTGGCIKFKKKIDVFFPVLHGSFGEDGTAQGLFEMMSVAYVGCDVLSSALAMNKLVCKQIAQVNGACVTKHIFLESKNQIPPKELYKQVEKQGLPIFVKPVSLGSSVGVTKVKNKAGLNSAVKKAFEYDKSVLLEKAVENAREIVCGVIGDGNFVKSTVCGEILITGREFYDYENKYTDTKSHRFIIPAKLPKKTAIHIKKMSEEIFSALGSAGFARVDFLLNSKTGKVFFSELNTIPGFTADSSFPLLWKQSGLGIEKLLDTLVNISLKAHRLKQKLKVKI